MVGNTKGGKSMHDILILGGGPAGISAGVAARQKGCSALVVSNPMEQNPLYRAERVNNYLGLPAMTGAELLNRFEEHARSMGVDFVTGRAVSAMCARASVFLTVGSDVYEGKKLILAGGVTRGIKYAGEEELLGRGVSYCATCDGMLYRNHPVVVVGRSKDAPMEANFLASIGCRVTYVSSHTPEGLQSGIPHVRGSRIAVVGTDRVTGVTVDGRDLSCDGVFILRESVAANALLPNLALNGDAVQVDREMHTNMPNVFAAGDITGEPLQIAKAVGEGLIAAECAAEELMELMQEERK